MKKRLILAMAGVFIPLMVAFALLISEQSFRLSLEKEQKQAQMTQALLFQQVAQALGENPSYAQINEGARAYRHFYAAQGIELALCYHGVPLAGAAFPNEDYAGLLTGRRCAMLDTRSSPQRYAVAQPLDAKTTLVMLLDVSELYRMRARMRQGALLLAALCALLAAGASWAVASRFVAPVTKLTRAALSLAEHTAVHTELPVRRGDEVGALSRAFLQMQRAISAREEALRDEAEKRQALLDALAHEMRTPLCALLGDARLMAHPRLTAREREAVSQRMAGEIKRLSQMDEQLMRLIRLRREPIGMESLSIKALLEQSVERLEGQADSVLLRLEGEDEQLTGDPLLLSLLADNLTVNAIRASRPGQAVTLRVEKGGFSVTDQGVGMTAQQLKNAFEPFYKADKARTRMAGGVGLGLSLCAAIAKAHGGRLTLASAPGRGTTARFTTLLQPCDDSVASDALSYPQEVKHP